MKAKNCCKTMEMELTAWKAIVYDITRQMEALPGGEKSKILPYMENLNILIAEMDDRIDEVRTRCTPETGMDDIRSEREAYEGAVSKLRMNAQEAMASIGAGNLGG